ncbi:MAG TPA: 5-formyltetrahydrofolate cyclo-ligase [Hanamia sp.]|nr:5-formyltetrahydrofolate cyclo-ligase [Hanamia sp.]
MTKQELRKVFKEKRQSLSVHDIEKFNDLILIHFQKSELPFISCVHTYLASLKLGEPDTTKIIRFLQFKNPLMKIAIPRVDILSGNMLHYDWEEEVEMIENVFGIEEPKGGNLVSENEIDMVIVPLLAFDQNGYRVGFGKGYYDKFLSKCRHDVIKFGLSLFKPVDEIEDINPFDIPLNYCATPQKLYIF